MCGIAGLMTRDGSPPPQRILQQLAAALAHRGPDGSGIIIRGDCGLAHTRLAIVDPIGGTQPLIAANGTALVANAEIYNDPLLRRELTQADFATGSDCESVLHLYCAQGAVDADASTAFTARLRGMYAVALHDVAARRLVLARDPFGIKPLYVADTPHGFAFASEPHALIAAGLVAASENAAVRDEFLALQFSCGRATAFAGIERLLPGEAIVVARGQIVARTRRSACPSPGEERANPTAARDRFDRIWADSVMVHQRADVPYGMFLSGGIDSAAILAMMRRLNATPPLAFTAAFPGTRAADERRTARAVAAAVGADHIEVEVDAADFWRTLPAVAAAMDDPAADYATVPTYLLAARAAEAVKVILSGEGGDEMFAGYGRYRTGLRPWPVRRRPWRKHRLAGLGLLRRTPPTSAWRRGIDAIEAEAAAAGYRALQALQAVDIGGWLPNDLLIKLDRCLMAHGVEGRVPFLDLEVAAFALRLPAHLKVRRRLGKWLLRQWLAEACPAAAALAPKQGFTVPVADWIGDEGPHLAPLVARQPGVAEVCDSERVEALFRAASPEHGGAMWILLFYALWHQHHILGRAGGDAFEALAQA